MTGKMCGMSPVRPDPVPPLLGVRAFEASARHLSFVAAADELHLSPSAISQRVRLLERHLDTQLFERRPRSLRLTSAGEAYLPAVRDLFHDLVAATSGIFAGSTRTSLAIRVQASYAVTWLAPRIHRFRAELPNVDLHVETAIWSDSLPPSEFDLDIRQGNGAWPGYRATKLHDDSAVAICGPGYLQRWTDHHAADLAGRSRVQVVGFDDLWRRFFPADVASDPLLTGPPGVITVDTSVAALAIVADSDLWTIVPERFAREAVRSGRVHQLPGPVVVMRQAHYLLRRDTSEPVTGESIAFERWLRAEDAADPALAPS